MPIGDGAAHARPPPTAGRRLFALAAVATIGVLAGCGSSSESPGSSGSSSENGSSKAPYTDTEACAWLKSSMPKSSDPMMAEAGPAMDLSTFFDQHGGLKNADGYAYDEAVARGCPTLRTKALKTAGLKSFGEIRPSVSA